MLAVYSCRRSPMRHSLEKGWQSRSEIGRANRKRILRAIRRAKKPLTRTQIARATMLSMTAVQRGLSRLVQEQSLRKLAPEQAGFAPKFDLVAK